MTVGLISGEEQCPCPFCLLSRRTTKKRATMRKTKADNLEEKKAVKMLLVRWNSCNPLPLPPGTRVDSVDSAANGAEPEAETLTSAIKGPNCTWRLCCFHLHLHLAF